jgi:predicted dehydrogenase
VDDSSSVLVELDNGAFGYVDANFNIPDAAARGRLEIYGTAGSMLAEGTIGQVEGGKLEVLITDSNLGYDAKQDRADVVPMEIKVEFGNMYTKEIESFSRSILEGKPAEISGENAVQVQKVIEAAYWSSDNGLTKMMQD